MTSLPVTDLADTRLGHARTSCGCPACAVSCRFVPGMLIPGDLARLAPSLSWPVLLAWARTHVLASPGALVMKNGVFFRIPTLVPARQAHGSACHWLTADGRCAVHHDAPYGCACFDAHQDGNEGHRRSGDGLQAILADRAAQGVYARLWQALWDGACRAPAPEESRRAMQQATGNAYAPHVSANERKDTP